MSNNNFWYLEQNNMYTISDGDMVAAAAEFCWFWDSWDDHL